MYKIFSVINKIGSFFRNDIIDNYVKNANIPMDLERDMKKHIIVNNKVLMYHSGPKMSTLPIIMSHSIIVITNSNINNYKHLKTLLEMDLPNYRFKFNNDMEIIIGLYLAYGSAFIYRLEGEFCFILYDGKKNVYITATDRLSSKKLYYIETDNNYIFSSESISLVEFNREIQFLQPGTVFINNNFYCYYKKIN